MNQSSLARFPRPQNPYYQTVVTHQGPIPAAGQCMMQGIAMFTAQMPWQGHMTVPAAGQYMMEGTAMFTAQMPQGQMTPVPAAGQYKIQAMVASQMPQGQMTPVPVADRAAGQYEMQGKAMFMPQGQMTHVPAAGQYMMQAIAMFMPQGQITPVPAAGQYMMQGTATFTQGPGLYMQGTDVLCNGTFYVLSNAAMPQHLPMAPIPADMLCLPGFLMPASNQPLATVSGPAVDPYHQMRQQLLCMQGLPFPQLTDGSWRNILEDELNKYYMKELATTLDKEYSEKLVFPPKHLVFNAFNLTPFDKVKVVILGQDPYFNAGEAMGLAFSLPPCVPVPARNSLANIYKELKEDVDIEGFEIPDHGSLENWAEQGVLLLNTALTVEAGKPNSHSVCWQPFTNRVISLLSENVDHLVFILLGNFAKAKANLINSSKHTVLEAGHPSSKSCKYFFGCQVFSKANTALSDHDQPTIDWRLCETNSWFGLM